MLQRLATYIRENLPALTDQYDELLRAVPGYANLPQPARHDLETHVLELVADCLEANDDGRLIQYIHERAEQVLSHGFQPEWFQQAVSIPQDIITPLATTVAESNFVWRVLGHAQTTAWEIVARERRRIELTLRESEARYQTIFDATPIMFWLKDTQNRTLRINKAAAELEGVKPSEVEGKSAYDLYPREQAEAFYQDDLEVIGANQPKLGIVEQHTSVGTGNLMWVETGKTPVHNDQGEVIGVLAFAVDVTERKQAEAKLRESEEQYRSAITAAGAVPYYIDYATESYRFIGEAIEKLTGYQAAEVTPNLFSQLIQETIMSGQGNDLSRAEAIQQARAGQLKGWKADYRLIDRSGQTRWLSDSSVQVLNEHDKPIGAVGILQDITERKRLEEQFRESLVRRGVQVQTSTEVAQEIASATDLNELFKRVVTLIKERFNYYHAQLFRYEPAQDAVVLITGYGEIGRKMLEAEHKLQMGRGVVGTAAATSRSILASDVRQDADWRPNPNLPETRGELAVPIKWRDQILGILDVQSERANTLTDDDRLLLEGLCGQIAIAMESKRLLDTVQESEQLMRTLIDAIPDYIYAKDLQGRHMLGNTALAQLYGLASPAELLGKTDFDFYPRELAEQYQASERLILHEGRSLLAHEELNIGADKQQRWNSTTKVPLRDPQGRIIGLVGITSDVTQRKEAELDLLKFKLGLEQSTAATFITDTAGVITYVNSAFEKIYGFTREEALGRTPRIIKSGLVPQEQYQQFWGTLLDGRTVAGEIVNKAKDGRLVFIDGSNSAILDEQGSIVGFLALHNDITARKRVEEVLRRNEAQLSEALKIAKLGYWEFDVERDLFLFNDQFYSIFHTTAVQAGGYQLSLAQYAQQFVHPDDLPVVGAEIEKALNSTERHYNRQIEHRIRYADGGVGYISVSINIDRDEQGRILRFYGANQDITQSKEDEARLQELFANVQQSERLMRTLIDAIPDEIYAKDSQGRLILANAAEAQQRGVASPDELIGQSDFDFYPRALAEQYFAAEQAIYQEGQSLINLEEHSVNAAGAVTWHSSTKLPLRNFQGQIIGLVGITRDITERKRAEQRMEETLHETERLYAAVNHESWQAYRQGGKLREGYVFDQTLIRPIEGLWEPAMAQALDQQTLITSQTGARPVTVAPLVIRGETIGALGVYDDPTHPLGQEDLELFAAVSEQVALALESARLFDQTQLALTETRALFRFSDLVSRETGIKSIYDSVAQLLVNEIGFVGAWIAQVDTEAQVLRGIAGAGLGMGSDRNFDVLPYQHMQTPVTIAARDGLMVVVNDPLHDERLSDLPNEMRVVVGKAIAVPIIIDGKIDSILAATRPVDGLDIGERDQRLLQTAAAQVAVAVQRARLFEQTQRDAEREHTINRVTSRIRNARSVDEVLTIAAQELRMATRASRSVVEISPVSVHPARTGNGEGVKA